MYNVTDTGLEGCVNDVAGKEPNQTLRKNFSC